MYNYKNKALLVIFNTSLFIVFFVIFFNILWFFQSPWSVEGYVKSKQIMEGWFFLSLSIKISLGYETVILPK